MTIHQFPDTSVCGVRIPLACDFGFWILDFGLPSKPEVSTQNRQPDVGPYRMNAPPSCGRGVFSYSATIQNPKSKIQNPRSILLVLVALTGLVALTVLMALPAFAQAPDLAHMDLVLRSVPDGPIAKVNGVNVNREEFVRKYQNEILAIMTQRHTVDIPDRARVAVAIRTLRALVEYELLYQEAAKRKYSVSDDEVKAQWSATVEKLKDSIGRLRQDDATKDGASKEAVSEEEILKTARTTKEKALEDLRRGILAKRVRDKIVEDAKVAVADAEVAKFFDEQKSNFKQPESLHLQQIFVKTRTGRIPLDEKGKAEVRKRIENALKRLQAGESFEAVAKSVSEAPDRDKGGDMGTLPVTALPPFFTTRAASMKPGETSEIIESELGFHIFKVLEIVPGSEATLEKAGPMIREMLLDRKTEEAVQAFCKPYLEDPAKVEVYLQLDRTLAAHPGFEDLKGAKEKPAEAKSAAPKSPSKSAAGRQEAASGNEEKSSGSSKKKQ